MVCSLLAQKRGRRLDGPFQLVYQLEGSTDSHSVRRTAENSARVTVSEGESSISSPELCPASRPTETDHSMPARAQEATWSASA